MNSRVSTRAQLLNTDASYRKEDTESDDGCSDSSSDDSDAEERPVTAANPTNKRSASMPISIAQPQNKKTRQADLSLHPALLRLKEAQLTQQHDHQVVEIDVRKEELRLREKEFLAREKQLKNEERLANARIEEATAQSLKLKEEAEHSRQQRKIELLRERKKLLDEGISLEEVDLLLPLRTHLEQVG
ncbi:hypothetical protein PF004_g17045 [Phytophthora fragariae]|uniref:Uncharacterized protein n=1 Tax=Phytophthora fragariae TaxID=53985 RepID=A0A6G0NGL4_9STRA|nr:hypothetical protein PF004_g17045 [Phytophthora fragariae]